MKRQILFEDVDQTLQFREANFNSIEVTINNTLNNKTRLSIRFFITEANIERFKEFVKEL